MSKKDVLKKIKYLGFPLNQYFRVEEEKKQIVLHHTVSGDNPKAVARYWAGRSSRIATCIIISRDGTPYQLFSSKYWGWHLGCKLKHFHEIKVPYTNLDKHSIGIELCSWGGLQEIDGKIYACYGNEIKDKDIIHLEKPYRGYRVFHTYTPEQIQTVRELMLYWNERYDIPLDYKEDMWDISKNAMSGEPGIWSHTSFRTDKSDLFPQKELIEMLKGLKEDKQNEK